MNDIWPGDMVIECAQAGRMGYLVYGRVKSIEKVFVEVSKNVFEHQDTVAVINLKFRDDLLEFRTPIDEVRLSHQNCHTCIHRLRHVVTGGQCPAKYELIEENRKI